MNRLAWAALVVLACACSGNASDAPDAATGGDGGIDPTGDGGTDPGGDGGPGHQPRTVKLTLTNRPMNAAAYSFFVAYQDGSAAWQVAPAPTGDTYSLPIYAPSYGIAFGCIGSVPGSTPTQLRAITTAQFAVGERTELSFDVPARCTDRGGDTVTLSGTIANRPSGLLVVQYGDRQAYVGGQSGTFSLQTPPGTRDLIVSHAVLEGNGEFYIDEALVIRDLAVTGPTKRTIDFAGAQNTINHDVTITVPGSNVRAVATTTLYTANGTTAGLVREASGWDSASLALPQRRTTDVYEQAITLSAYGRAATITHATATPGDQTFVPPAPLGAVSSQVVTKQPYPIVLSTWPAYASGVGYTWSAAQQLGPQGCATNMPCTIAWTAYVSPGVSGAMPGYQMPDLAAVPGWRSAFALVAGVQTYGSVTAQTSSAGAGDFPPATPGAAGTKRVYVRSDYAVTP